MIVIALMSGGFIGVVVTCCMVAAKKSDEELGDMMKEKREGTLPFLFIESIQIFLDRPTLLLFLWMNHRVNGDPAFVMTEHTT